jgi:hypothetical protein
MSVFNFTLRSKLVKEDYTQPLHDFLLSKI